MEKKVAQGRADMAVQLKVGRKILDIGEDDMVLDNGVIYQIITKKTS